MCFFVAGISKGKLIHSLCRLIRHSFCFFIESGSENKAWQVSISFCWSHGLSVRWDRNTQLLLDIFNFHVFPNTLILLIWVLCMVTEVLFTCSYGVKCFEASENLAKKSLPLNLIMIALSFIFSRLSERRWSDKAWGRRNFKGTNK